VLGVVVVLVELDGVVRIVVVVVNVLVLGVEVVL